MVAPIRLRLTVTVPNPLRHAPLPRPMPPPAAIPPFACAATGAPTGRARLVAETTLTVNDLIWPIVRTSRAGGRREPVASMPGASPRVSVDLIRRSSALRRASLGIPAIALFPDTPIPTCAPRTHARRVNPEQSDRRAARRRRRHPPRGAGDWLGDGARPLHQPRP